MSEMKEPKKFEEGKDGEYTNGAVISKTGLNMSEIISVLEGRSIVFEVDKSVWTKTDEIATALLGETTVDFKNQSDRNNAENFEKGYLSDELHEVDHAKEKMEETLSLLEELENTMHKVLQNQSVEYYTPLEKSGGFKGKVVYKIRSFVRKFLEYIFAPILKQQNSLNSWVARTEEKNVELLREYTIAVREECHVEIKVQEKRNQILEEKLIKQENLLNKALQEIDELRQNQGNQK